MVLPKTSTPKLQHGFTLMELLVVIAIFAIVSTFGVIVSMDAYRSYSFRSERDLVISLIQKARSQAVNNVDLNATPVNGASHGIRFTGTSYVLFQGPWGSNPSLDQTVNQSTGVTVTSSTSLPVDIVFSQLTGNAQVTPAGSQITLTGSGANTQTISVNSSGQIIW